MKIFYRDKPRVLVLVSETHSLLFRDVTIEAERPKCLMEMVPNSALEPTHLRKLSNNEIHGSIGLIKVEGLLYLVTITGKYEVARPLKNQSINKILNVEFFCLNSDKYDELTMSAPNVDSGATSSFDELATDPSLIAHPCNDLKKLLSDGSFYYSTNFDLTNSLQSRGVHDDSLSIDTYKEEFMWNYFMMNEMIQFRNKSTDVKKKLLDSNGFLTTVIRGFAKTTKIGNNGTSFSIISRQSWKRAGTRYNARGVDDDGYVANFVETEVILSLTHHVYSFIEIRGSIPVFWEQDSQLSLSTPKVQITRSAEATHPIFLKHFNSLVETYGIVHVVNLLSTKSSEIELSNRYKDHIDLAIKSGGSINSNNLKYIKFDFHHETKGGNYSSARKILRYVEESIENFGYYSVNLDTSAVELRQQGVFRTNCLDCLDRTNLTQQVLGSRILELLVQDYELRFGASDIYQIHNSLWADNGDQISQIYTGTNALKSSFSRSGKMTLGLFLSDATKSVTRMYQNNFVDKSKQVTIDTLLGRVHGQRPVVMYDPVSENVERQLIKRSSEFTHESVKNIYVSTFNVNGLLPLEKDFESIQQWILPDNDYFYTDFPDIYILGIQEVVELNATNILNADTTRSGYWQKIVNQVLDAVTHDNPQVQYTLIRAEQMASLLILFFAKTELAPKITKVEGYTKKTGLGGIAGNKGAVAIRFNIGATSFCALNSHLASGQQASLERRSDYEQIVKNVYFSRSGNIFDHENVIWLGDLNYRIDLPNEQVRMELNADSAHNLLQYDQLLKEIHFKNAFQRFSESEITFKPTYKFDNQTNNYDSSEKQRTPSWTDRVLFRGPLSPVVYDSVPEVLFSDHKPVYCLFEVTVKFVNEEAKQQLKSSLYEDYKKSVGSSKLKALVDIVNGSSQTMPPLPNRRASTFAGTGAGAGNGNSNSNGHHGNDINASLIDLDPTSPKAHTFMNKTKQQFDLLSIDAPQKTTPLPPKPRKSVTEIGPSPSYSTKPESPVQAPLKPASTSPEPVKTKPLVPAPRKPPPGFTMSLLRPQNKSTSPSPSPPPAAAAAAATNSVTQVTSPPPPPRRSTMPHSPTSVASPVTRSATSTPVPVPVPEQSDAAKPKAEKPVAEKPVAVQTPVAATSAGVSSPVVPAVSKPMPPGLNTTLTPKKAIAPLVPKKPKNLSGNKV